MSDEQIPYDPDDPLGVPGVPQMELVKHLIAEHGISPISSRWEETVKAAEDHFRDVQRKRLL
jgi:hypothetical protein